jgi:hypothetical protein
MQPKERRETGEQDLFRSRLDQIIDLQHRRRWRGPHRHGRGEGAAAGTGGSAASTSLLTGAKKIAWPARAAGLAPCRRRRHCTGVRTSGVAQVRESAGELGPRKN